jgi:hypothetical protein
VEDCCERFRLGVWQRRVMHVFGLLPTLALGPVWVFGLVGGRVGTDGDPGWRGLLASQALTRVWRSLLAGWALGLRLRRQDSVLSRCPWVIVASFPFGNRFAAASVWTGPARLKLVK